MLGPGRLLIWFSNSFISLPSLHGEDFFPSAFKFPLVSSTPIGLILSYAEFEGGVDGRTIIDFSPNLGLSCLSGPS